MSVQEILCPNRKGEKEAIVMGQIKLFGDEKAAQPVGSLTKQAHRCRQVPRRELFLQPDLREEL